jgi:hypothetical protein
MREIVKNKTILTQHTFSEYVEFSKKHRRDDKASSRVTNSGDKNFYGDAYNYEDMYSRCYDGYNAKKVGDIRGGLVAKMAGEKESASLYYYGDDLDVPTFLSGEQRCFWNDGEGMTKPRIHIVYQGTASCAVKAKNFINHGGAVAAICDLLSEDAHTKVSTVYLMRDSVTDTRGGNMLQSIDVKDYSESLDVPRIGALTHPSFFRRIAFGHIEYYGAVSGYGYPVEIRDKTKIVSEQDYLDWMRIDPDEFVLEVRGPADSIFSSEESTLGFIRTTIDKVNELMDAGERYLKDK